MNDKRLYFNKKYVKKLIEQNKEMNGCYAFYSKYYHCVVLSFYKPIENKYGYLPKQYPKYHNYYNPPEINHMWRPELILGAKCRWWNKKKIYKT